MANKVEVGIPRNSNSRNEQLGYPSTGIPRNENPARFYEEKPERTEPLNLVAKVPEDY